MSTYRSISVATLLRGRQEHFDHLVAGLRAQTSPPDELVVAHMQPDPPAVAAHLPFPVRFVAVPGEELPLAAARNAAASEASGDILAFLDVDCIPDPELVRRASEALVAERKAVLLPEVRYLPATERGWREDGSALPDYIALERAGQRHEARPDLSDVATRRIDDHGQLWGLAFILGRADWFAAGGMDERFVGYGAEETDFAQRLRMAGLDLYWLGGTVCYHQHHAVHIPPLQHFDAIVRNAQLFRRKWGRWCMEYWLNAFTDAGLIRILPDAIEVLRRPGPAEVAASRQGPDVRFS